MATSRIAIIGGGLSGLYAAFLLEQAGLRDYVLLEARDRLGGRILSVPVAGQSPAASPSAAAPASLDRVDLGPTWMAPHAKYLAVYDTAFWRDQGLSGDARSLCGPLGEIHDAAMPGGSAVGFGFFGLSAQTRAGIAEDVLRAEWSPQFPGYVAGAIEAAHLGVQAVLARQRALSAAGGRSGR